MSFVAVLPSIHPPYTWTCLQSMHPAFRAHTHVIDNTHHNFGVPASWNAGIARMRHMEADWLVIVSAACRFSPVGGMDLIDQLDPDGFPVVEARYVGWHLIAFHQQVFDKVGRFDENFYPAYWEDCDFSRRLALAYELEPPFWTKVEVEVALESFAHGLQLAGVTVVPENLAAYYVEKWGGMPSHETFTTPFDSGRPLSYWPEPVAA